MRSAPLFAILHSLEGSNQEAKTKSLINAYRSVKVWASIFKNIHIITSARDAR